jgi:hypothetical protein
MIDDARAYPSLTTVVPADQLPALRHAAALITESLEPAPPHRIVTMVGKLAIAFPQQKLSDDEADVRIEQYTEGLDDIPIDILTDAYKTAIKTRTFFPTVAELRALCGELARRKWRLSRINSLIASAARGGTPALAYQSRDEDRPPDRGKPDSRGTTSAGDAARRALDATHTTDTTQRGNRT